MSVRRDPFRALLAIAVLAAALLTSAPGASADVTSRTAASVAGSGALGSPRLDSATIRGDNVVLLWTPVAGDVVRSYAIYADGAFVFRTLPSDSATIFLTSEGLTGREEYTVVAENSAGAQSPPSNGLVPTPPATLPAPVLTSATREDGTTGSVVVTLTWTPSRTNEASGHIGYFIFADRFLVMQVNNTTSVTFSPDACGGSCPLTGREVYTVVARDRTLAESPTSNGLVPSAG